ncbi:MAG: sigma-70 family RNA polymerase sigma factor [Actinomycetota bacterium]
MRQRAEDDDTAIDGWQQLLESARAASDSAWTSLYDEFAPLVIRYLRARNCPDAEDVLGEVFLRVVRNLASFTGEREDFRAWIVTIAHRRMIDERRRRQRRPLELVETDVLQTLAPAGDVEEDCQLALSTAEIRNALDGLSVDQRDVLALRFLGGLRIGEIAQAVGKSPDAVKALQARGIASLRRKIRTEAVTK